MAPRRVLLLILVASIAAAACPHLGSSPVVARGPAPHVTHHPATAATTSPVSGNDGDTKGSSFTVGSIMFVMGFVLGVFVSAVNVCIFKDDEDESARDGGAIAKNPEVVFTRAAGATKPCRGN